MTSFVSGTLNRFIVRNIARPSLIKVRHARRMRPIDELPSGTTYHHPERVKSAAEVRRRNDDDFVQRPKSSDDLVRKVTPITTGRKEKESKKKDATFDAAEKLGVNYYVPTRSKMSQLLREEVGMARNKSKREEHRCIVVEGLLPLIHTLKAGAEVQSVFFAGKTKNFLGKFKQSVGGHPSGDVKLYNVDFDLLKAYMFYSVGVSSKSGVYTVATVKMPNVGEAPSPPTDPIPVTVVLDNIKDLAELGRLVRYITATKCKRLIVLDSCEDVWDTRCLYSAFADHFKIPIYTGIPLRKLKNYINNDDGDKYSHCVYVTSAGIVPRSKKSEKESRKSSEEVNDVEDYDDDDSLTEDDDSDHLPIVNYFKEDFSLYSDITVIISPDLAVRQQDRSVLVDCDSTVLTLPVQPKPHCPSFTTSLILSKIHEQMSY